jgi:membrane peptidoglycan carboxypeptidase
MIGELIKISPKQLPTVSGSRQRKVRFWRRTWFKSLLLFSVFGLLATYVGVMLWLRQFRERAGEFDLTQMKKLEISTILHDRNGREFAEIAEETRRTVRLDDVPYHFIQALSAAEDGRFFEHKGVDYMGMARATLMNLRSGKKQQGASTITQQLARQTFAKSDPSMLAKTIERKITEVYLAKRIEENFTKSEILEMYLNRIYFGSGCWGVNAAAMRYFGKPVRELDLGESATICGLIKSPERYSPLKDLAAAQRNRNQVLNRMVEEKFLSATDSATLQAAPLIINPTQAAKGGGYLVDKIHQEVGPILEELGYDEIAGQGLHIYTSLDADVQKQAEESVRKRLTEIENRAEYTAWLQELNARDSHKDKPRVTYQRYLEIFDQFQRSLKTRPDPTKAIAPDPNYLQAAAVLLDNKTGDILAMVGGRDFVHNKLNLAESRPGHAPGTAFTPFVFAAAFEDKMFPGTRLSDAPLDNSRIMVGSTEGILGEWGREGQTDLFQGKITARGALIQSMNGASARLGLDTGLEKVRDFAVRAGLEETKPIPAALLGTSEIPLRDLALAYTTFPNGGKRIGSTQLLTKITDSEGRLLWQRSSPKPAVLVTDEITAYMITSCLEDSLSVGTGSPAKDYGLMDGSFAGKTGTHYEFRDLTFAGYSSEVTCAVWTGMRDRPETIYPSAFSNKCALPIWVDIMNAISAKRAPQPFAIPETIRQIELCAVSGLRATDRCFNIVDDPNTGRKIYSKTTYKEYTRPGFKFDAVCDMHVGENHREGTLPEEAAQRPDIVLEKANSSPNSIPGAGNPIPVVLKETVVMGNDPYQSLQPTIRIPTAIRVSEEPKRPGAGILESPDINKKIKIDIPEPTPVKIE